MFKKRLLTKVLCLMLTASQYSYAPDPVATPAVPSDSSSDSLLTPGEDAAIILGGLAAAGAGVVAYQRRDSRQLAERAKSTNPFAAAQIPQRAKLDYLPGYKGTNAVRDATTALEIDGDTTLDRYTEAVTKEAQKKRALALLSTKVPYRVQETLKKHRDLLQTEIEDLDERIAELKNSHDAMTEKINKAYGKDKASERAEARRKKIAFAALGDDLHKERFKLLENQAAIKAKLNETRVNDRLQKLASKDFDSDGEADEEEPVSAGHVSDESEEEEPKLSKRQQKRARQLAAAEAAREAPQKTKAAASSHAAQTAKGPVRRPAGYKPVR